MKILKEILRTILFCIIAFGVSALLHYLVK